MPPQGAELDIPGVGVRVEVDHRDPTRAEHIGHAGGVSERDGVVAAKDQRDRASGGDAGDRSAQVAQRLGSIAGEQLYIAGVVDPQVLQAISTQRQAGTGIVMAQVVGRTDGLRTKAAPGRCVVPPSNGAPRMTTSAPA